MGKVLACARVTSVPLWNMICVVFTAVVLDGEARKNLLRFSTALYSG